MVSGRTTLQGTFFSLRLYPLLMEDISTLVYLSFSVKTKSMLYDLLSEQTLFSPFVSLTLRLI